MHESTVMMTKLYQILTKKWYIDFLLSVIPVIWITIIQTVGKQFNITDKDGNLKGVNLVIFLICIMLSLVYNGFKVWQEGINKKRELKGQKSLQDIISSSENLCSKKMNKLLNYINKNHNKQLKNPFWSIIYPREQLSLILDELNICLSKHINIRREDIGLSIAYKYDFSDNWKSDYAKNTSNGNFSRLINNSQSTISQITNGNLEYIFWADKKEAYQMNQYVISSKDNKSDLKGSIICINISVACNGYRYTNAVLNISTYNDKLCEDDDKNMQEKIVNVLIKPFLTRMKLELCYDYIRAYNSYQQNKYQNEKNVTA